MSKEKKEEIGTWLYRGLAIYFLWNIYLDVNSIDVIKAKVDKNEKEIERLQDAVFTKVWFRRSTPLEREEHLEKTNALQEETERNLAESKELLEKVDSVFEHN